MAFSLSLYMYGMLMSKTLLRHIYFSIIWCLPSLQKIWPSGMKISSYRYVGKKHVPFVNQKSKRKLFSINCMWITVWDILYNYALVLLKKGKFWMKMKIDNELCWVQKSSEKKVLNMKTIPPNSPNSGIFRHILKIRAGYLSFFILLLLLIMNMLVAGTQGP